MKKISFLLSCAVASVPFSFVKMKGPFTIVTPPNSKEVKIIKLDRIDSRHNRIINNLWLFNDKSGYVLGSLLGFSLDSQLSLRDKSTLDFFQGANNITELSYKSCSGGKGNNESNTGFCFSKEGPNLKLNVQDWNRTNISNFFREVDVWKRRNNIPFLNPVEYVKSHPNPNVQAFDIDKSGIIKTGSGVTLANHGNKVIIKTSNGAPYDLRKVLLNYYNKSLLNYFEKTLEKLKGTSSNTDPIKRLEKKLGEDKGLRDLLKRSQILSVYAVLKGEQGKDSIIMGIAKPITNRQGHINLPNEWVNLPKNFHWVVDLEDEDVSVLMEDITEVKKADNINSNTEINEPAHKRVKIEQQ